MDISTLDGFLTAIVFGPKTIMPSEWLRWVRDMESGKDAPEFKEQAQAQRMLGLLMRHMNDIAETLQQAPDHYEPLLMENPNNGDPIPLIDEWCSGFMKGVQLDSEGWLPVVSGKPDWMSTIMLYGTEDGWEALKKKNFSVDEHKALAAGLAGAVQKIHAFWLEQRREQIAGGTWPDVVRREPIRIRTRSAATSPAPVDRVRSSNSVTAAPTGCTEARGNFQRGDGFSGGTGTQEREYFVDARQQQRPGVTGSATIGDSGTRVIRLPPRSPNLNAYAERFVRSIKDECLNRMIFVGQASLRRAVAEYMAHYHCERNHQGLRNRLIRPIAATTTERGSVHCHTRLGGVLNFYHREAA